MMFLRLGATFMLFSLLASAIGAHALTAYLTTATSRDVYTEACYWLAWQGLALLWAHTSATAVKSLSLRWPMLLVAVGTVLFSGGLMASAILGYRLPWPVAPAGGSLMMLGWAAVLFNSFRLRAPN